MKPILSNTVLNFRILFILFSIFTISERSIASHGMGGEITWTCQPNGSFIFELKFYRDCNGIPAPASVSLNTTVPGIPSIACNLYSQRDISNQGLRSDGITSCLNCTQGGGGMPTPGLVEERVYRSLPIVLPGVPPINGWTFFWGECCRNANLTNVTGAGSLGFSNRAIMYPYQGSTTQPCFDSSPYFTEPPAVIICTGIHFEYSTNTIDPERDSLVYTWGQPLDDGGTTIPFAPGYSINNQLPSIPQDPLTLDPRTGKISLTSTTGGYFVTNVKVTAYKCGIKVAEIFREISIAIINNCPTVGGNVNSAPDIVPPFINTSTGLQTSYTDTVNAGDTVNFNLDFTDLDLFDNGLGQTLTIRGSGAQFGAGYINASSGCLTPPCATLNDSLPLSFLAVGQVTFNWVTSCDHISSVLPCTNEPNTYKFTFQVSDNYCPSNAREVATVSITVLPIATTVSIGNPGYTCQDDTLILIASGASAYLWSNGATGDTLIVTQPGTYYATAQNTGTCTGPSQPFYFYPGVNFNVNATAAQTNLCINWQPTALTGTPAGGSWSGPGVSGSLFDPAVAGAGNHIITYTFTDSLGCTGTDLLFMEVDLCTGIEEVNYSNAFSIFPNPATDKIVIHFANENSVESTVQLLNIYGQVVSNFILHKTQKENMELDISHLSPGVYFIRFAGIRNGVEKFVKY